jgi:hypothetical protein
LWLRHASLAAVSLLGVFLGAMIAAYAKGLAIDCGCFGAGEALSAKTLVRDAMLVGMAGALTILSRRDERVAHARRSA